MKKRSFLLATAGHVDHGKSAIVKALTQVDPDRLPEERRRGITIELGFALLQAPSPSDPSVGLQAHVIDVPGHEDFVNNTVAGMGCVDLGLIVVAADSGWMPQTEEHFQILEYLDVRRIVVALNKIDLDLLDESFLRELIRSELAATRFEQAPIVATSTKTGQGIDELKTVIARTLDALPDPSDQGKPRLSVDRVFSAKGHGTVVTGSLIGGRLRIDQPVVVQPHGVTTRIRALQSFGQAATEADPGTRVAVNLAQIGIRQQPRTNAKGVGRGDVIIPPAIGEPSRIIDAIIGKSPRLDGLNVPAAKPLRHGARVRFHHGSANTPGRLFFLERSELKPGEETLGELRLEREVMALEGDRFVLRDWSQTHTLAGGTILDGQAKANRFRSAEQRRYLTECRQANSDLTALVKAHLVRERAIAETQVMHHSRYGPQTLAGALDELERTGSIVRRRGIVFESGYWNSRLDLTAQAVDRYHRTYPDRPGLPLSELRSSLDDLAASSEGTEVLIASLPESDYIVESTMIRRADHVISLPAQLESIAARLLETLNEAGLEPPAAKQLLTSAEQERTARFLIASGKAIKLGEELILSRTTYDRLRDLTVDYLRGRQRASVSELRQHTRVSRRIMLPLLEHLDALGVTCRTDDWRHLKK